MNWRSAAARRLFRLAGNPSNIHDAILIAANSFRDGVPCPPTDLEAIGRRVNIRAVDLEILPFSGELRRDGDGFKIVCSKHLSPTRRRFTIAHEIGHAILETTGPRCPRFGGELERICNLLATELLMPETLFVQRVGKDLTLQRIFELANLFSTSLSSTAIRCAELLGISTFGTDGRIVSWGYGIVKKGSTFSWDEEMRRTIERASNGQAGQESVYLRSRTWTGEWLLEWAPLGRDGKAIFLLQPNRLATQIQAHR